MPFPLPEPNLGLERVRHELRTEGVPDETPNPLRSGIHTRGYLPHVKREGAEYFVTFRLADSLPKSVLLELKRYQAEALRNLEGKGYADREEVNRDFRRRLERYLDRGAGACFLKRPAIADLVREGLLYGHEKQYLLREWVVMPNHVHLLIWPLPGWTLSQILRDRKSRTARGANRLLNRTGECFWQDESYDHWVRNPEERIRISRYIRNNPVIAKLCRSPEDWPWSSAAGGRKGKINGGADT